MELGFTEERFDGYLWRKPDAVFISFIESKQPNRGHFRRLCEAILAKNLAVKIPTPLGRMAIIVRKAGYRKTIKDNPDRDPVEVWIKQP